MGIPAQRHQPIKGNRAIEHERHAALHARPAPHPSTGLAHIDPRIGSRPKVEHDVPVHGGMTSQQKATAGTGGMGHGAQVQGGGHAITESKNAIPSAYNEDAMTAMAEGVPHPKYQPLKPVPGHRSRTNSRHPNDQGAGDVVAMRKLTEGRQ